ncbi:MAG TPA: TetR-like C-terminal domain-containing protein [Solirubrobacteraceae bacterium]|jgi:AcrR family transcriptional regulator|nr:TetR-like C-terminal domain-containing protein [Solirubrobacteraceae bacterium]
MPRAGLDSAVVVEAAAAIADADGLDAVTLSSVAARLGVKPPSLYAHVGGLPDLKQRLAGLAAAELAEALTPAVAGRAAGDALREAGRAYRRWALAHPGRHAALQFVRVDDNPAAERAVELMVSVMRGYALEGDAAIHAVRAMRAAIYGFVTLEAGGGFGIPLDTDESFEWLLTLLDRGLADQAP